MASTSKCPYCGGTMNSEEKYCTHCGAVNENHVEDTQRQIFQPKTIDELKEYCAERGMPLLRMRFFIGEDFKEPKAFGIYQDGDRYIVYKNKDNGTRAIRYQGPDEAYAVNELFQKLLSECHNRGIFPDGQPDVTRSAGSSSKKKKKTNPLIFIGVFMWLLLVISVLSYAIGEHKHDGYYKFDNSSTTWYRYGYGWYYSDIGSSDWYNGDPSVGDDYADYYVGDDYDSDWGVTDFMSSDTYDDLRSSSSSGSSNSDSYDSGFDSWDSGGTDWSSDW